MAEWNLSEMLSSLHGGIQNELQTARKTLAHPGTKGDASERVWLELLQTYLPKRYQVESAHVVDSEGNFSDQMDVVVFDRQYSPFIFNFKAAKIVPAESVYAVFEAKQTMDASLLTYAKNKIASVRRLKCTSLPIPHAGGEYPAKPPIHILGGMLTLESEWNPPLSDTLIENLGNSTAIDHLDLGCVASHGFFGLNRKTQDYDIHLGKKPATGFLFHLIPALCNTIEGARYRDMLARAGQARSDRVMTLSALEIISQSLSVVAGAVPAIGGDVLVEVTQFVHPINHAVQNVIAPFFTDNDYNHFKKLKDQLDANLHRTHRTNPIYPRDYKNDDVVDAFLAGTVLKDLFALRTPFAIPEASRFEHMHIVAGSGHGKTQTLQYFIAKDLEDVARGDKSIVVIDSQGDLINTILKAKTLPAEKIVLIDPEDIAFPVSLNLFSVGQDRLAGYGDLERERLTNSIIELYDFVLGSLLSAGMTAKQSVVFRYVTRLMFHIPDATIHTLRDLMEPGGTDKYREHINKLEGTPRRFFETEFDSKEFTNTRVQVLRRLYGVLENQTFERMFSNPQSKFDMFTEINAGKLILINTSKSLLKEQGTQIFGRFFIALIAQAAQERSTLPDYDRLPTMVYIDEAQDYFDQNIGLILSQARKYKVGMIMAHQYLGQLSNGLQEAFEANTSIKLAGGVSARDARVLASQMSSDPETIQRQPKGTFATFVRGLTQRAVPISFPFFVMERMPQASDQQRKAIREYSRKTYAEPLRNSPEHSEPAANEEIEKPDKNDGEDPSDASKDL